MWFWTGKKPQSHIQYGNAILKVVLVEERHVLPILALLEAEQRQDIGTRSCLLRHTKIAGVLGSKEEKRWKDLYITPREVEAQKGMIRFENGFEVMKQKPLSCRI